ncbi:MAG: hypothetical protein Q9170_000883 [Blastenia crenularia]
MSGVVSSSQLYYNRTRCELVSKRGKMILRSSFFPGNHGDVGGGWPAPGGNAANEANDSVQLSHLALEWMISELDALRAKHLTDQIMWNKHKVSDAVKAPMHDTLAWKGGISNRVSVFMWHLLEWLPFFKRLELLDGEWESMFFPPHNGGTRDIPENAIFHKSVKQRMLKYPEYRPTNLGSTVKSP